MANIKLNNNEYPIPDSALAGPRAELMTHLATIAGSGLRVVINGVEYGIDSNKIADAVTELETVLGNLHSDDLIPSPTSFTPGLYQTGAIALYEEQGAEAVEGMMVTSWDELLADGVVHVEDGVVYSNFDIDTEENSSASILVGDLILPNDGTIVNFAESAFDTC
jgi:hypothetical protein